MELSIFPSKNVWCYSEIDLYTRKYWIIQKLANLIFVKWKGNPATHEIMSALVLCRDFFWLDELNWYLCKWYASKCVQSRVNLFLVIRIYGKMQIWNLCVLNFIYNQIHLEFSLDYLLKGLLLFWMNGS